MSAWIMVLVTVALFALVIVVAVYVAKRGPDAISITEQEFTTHTTSSWPRASGRPATARRLGAPSGSGYRTTRAHPT